MENTNKGDTLQTTDAVGVSETATTKISPSKPWFDSKRSKKLNGILSSIPGNHLPYTECCEIAEILTDYAKVCEKLKEEDN